MQWSVHFIFGVNDLLNHNNQFVFHVHIRSMFRLRLSYLLWKHTVSPIQIFMYTCFLQSNISLRFLTYLHLIVIDRLCMSFTVFHFAIGSLCTFPFCLSFIVSITFTSITHSVLKYMDHFLEWAKWTVDTWDNNDLIVSSWVNICFVTCSNLATN